MAGAAVTPASTTPTRCVRLCVCLWGGGTWFGWSTALLNFVTNADCLLMFPWQPLLLLLVLLLLLLQYYEESRKALQLAEEGGSGASAAAGAAPPKTPGGAVPLADVLGSSGSGQQPDSSGPAAKVQRTA